MDIVGPLPVTENGYTHILTIQDLLTKYSIAVSLGTTTSIAIADAFLKHFIYIYGAPRDLLTNQGTNLLSALIRHLTKKFNIKHYKTTAYHPQSNGSIERSHHVLIEYLKIHVNKELNWDEYLYLAMFSYNTSVHEGTKFSPYELIFGRLPKRPISDPPIEENFDLTYQEYLINLYTRLRDIQDEARDNLIKSKEKSKRYYDQRMNPIRLREGNYFFLLKQPSKEKFAAQYTGPHKNTQILSTTTLKSFIKIDLAPYISIN